MEAPTYRKDTRSPNAPRGGGMYDLPGLEPLRKAQRLSRAELAERAGITGVTVWNLENGKRLARVKTVYALADALGVPPMDLVLPPEGDHD